MIGFAALGEVTVIEPGVVAFEAADAGVVPAPGPASAAVAGT